MSALIREEHPMWPPCGCLWSVRCCPLRFSPCDIPQRGEDVALSLLPFGSSLRRREEWDIRTSVPFSGIKLIERTCVVLVVEHAPAYIQKKARPDRKSVV